MALKINNRAVFQNPGLYTGSQGFWTGNTIKGGLRNRFVGGLNPKLGGMPSGVIHPAAFVMPQEAGAISSEFSSVGSISGSGNLIPIRPMIGSSTLELININAQLDQIVSGVATGTLSLTKVNAILASVASFQANGVGSLTKQNALCGAIFSVLASSNGSITGSGSTISAIGHMDADAGGPTPLSPEGLAIAVWNASSSDHNDTGTMGELLNSSGGGSSPSSIALEIFDNQDVETGYSLREALRIILAALGGKVSGAGTSTITIRSATDNKDRIIATVDSNGNRSSVTLDVT